MSQRALLLAVRDRLRDAPANGGLGFVAAECEVMFDGQPPPICGERFSAIWPGEWTGHYVEGADEMLGVNVTVTLRVGKVPRDRMGVNALVGPTGQNLDQLLESIRAKLHMDPGPRTATDARNYPVLTMANAYITALLGPNNGFVEPLQFQNGGRPEPKGPEWFEAASDVEGATPPVGIAQTLSFGGARRLQTIESEV